MCGDRAGGGRTRARRELRRSSSPDACSSSRPSSSLGRSSSLSRARALSLSLFFLLYLSFTKRAHNLPLSEKTFTDSAPMLKGYFQRKYIYYYYDSFLFCFPCSWRCLWNFSREVSLLEKSATKSAQPLGCGTLRTGSLFPVPVDARAEERQCYAW